MTIMAVIIYYKKKKGCINNSNVEIKNKYAVHSFVEIGLFTTQRLTPDPPPFSLGYDLYSPVINPFQLLI